jgi:hypothetical protein
VVLLTRSKTPEITTLAPQKTNISLADLLTLRGNATPLSSSDNEDITSAPTKVCPTGMIEDPITGLCQEVYNMELKGNAIIDRSRDILLYKDCETLNPNWFQRTGDRTKCYRCDNDCWYPNQTKTECIKEFSWCQHTEGIDPKNPIFVQNAEIDMTKSIIGPLTYIPCNTTYPGSIQIGDKCYMDCKNGFYNIDNKCYGPKRPKISQ